MESLRQQYDTRGFAVVEEAIPESALSSVREAAARIVGDFDIGKHKAVFTTGDRDRGRDEYFLKSAETVRCFLEEHALDRNGELNRPRNQAINKIGHALHDHVPEVGALCRLPVIVQTLRAIGYRHARLWQTMYIFKQPGIGGAVRWHQDASYLLTEPPAVTGLWIAIDRATRENGCLWVLPGGHRGPLREAYEVDPESRKGTLRVLNDTPWPERDEAHPIEVAPGSLVLLHDHLPHCSSRNRSARSRHAITMHFAPENVRWRKRNWLHRRQLAPFVV